MSQEETFVRTMDVVFLRDNAPKLIRTLVEGRRNHGPGCAVINASQVMETRQIRWNFLPISRVPERRIKRLIRQCSRNPLLLSVVVLLKPDGSRSAYMISYMVDMIDNFPNDKLVIIESIAQL